MTEAELLEVIAKAASENATSLDLSGQNIKTIPPEIAQLTNLRELNLSENQITQIPDAIAQLTNLRELNLSENQITEIPDAIEALSKLEDLDLRGNPLTIPPEILGSDYESGSVEDILNYFRQLRSGEVLPLNEAK
jgi:internalin A